MSSVHVQATTRIGTYNAYTLKKQVQVASEMYYIRSLESVQAERKELAVYQDIQ